MPWKVASLPQLIIRYMHRWQLGALVVSLIALPNQHSNGKPLFNSSEDRGRFWMSPALLYTSSYLAYSLARSEGENLTKQGVQ